MTDELQPETPKDEPTTDEAKAEEEGAQLEEFMEQQQEQDARARAEGLVGQELEKFVSFTDRIIYLEGEVDIFTPAFIRRRIEAIAKITQDSTTPITLSISSYGGDVYAALGVIDIMRGAPMPINTVGYGPVMSAAGFILVAGTGKRQVTENSYVMLHDIFGMIKGRSQDVMTETDHWKKLQDRCNKLFASRTKKNLTYWKKKSKATYYLTADEAMTYGVIDEVLKKWEICLT